MSAETPDGAAPPSAAPVIAATAAIALPFQTLLYRYLFFSWLFRDVGRGNLFERAAAWRHNQAQAHWLLTYMRRWCGCGLLCMGVGSVIELGLNAPVLSAFFYVPGVLSVPINTVIGVAWLGLRLLHAPL
jgi:hypothetical protein